MACLARNFEAHHFAVFDLPNDEAPQLLLAGSVTGEPPMHTRMLADRPQYRRLNPIWGRMRRCGRNSQPTLLQFDVTKDVDPLLRTQFYDQAGLRMQFYDQPGMNERNVICGMAAGRMLGLALVRHRDKGPLGDPMIGELRTGSAGLLALVAKHHSIVSKLVNLSSVLDSLPAIERRVLANTAQLPRREAQVCARILYGISSAGIALELDISEETVATYRKRAYHRLSIGSQYELLRWYMSECVDKFDCPPRPATH